MKTLSAQRRPASHGMVSLVRRQDGGAALQWAGFKEVRRFALLRKEI